MKRFTSLRKDKQEKRKSADLTTTAPATTAATTAAPAAAPAATTPAPAPAATAAAIPPIPEETAPARNETGFTSLASDEAVPEQDPSSTAELLEQRLHAWKHAVEYLEEYVEAVEKIHKSQAKDYEKVLKTISKPLKYGQHFDQSLGGIAGFFENMRVNTQALINTNLETEKNIKGTALPIIERLHKEIKHKAKEIAHGAEKGAKEVEKARNTTQKHIELLGQHTASFESAGGKITAQEDPYVISRGVLHRLNKQVLEENNHHNDLVAVQTNFEIFEKHIIEVLHEAMETFTNLTGGQAAKVQALHADMLSAAQRIPPEFEWNAFVKRSADILADPAASPRTVEAIQFPNMAHPSTKPLIEGTLERKSRNKLSFGYSTGYYVVTPAKFLHEFKDDDNVRQDPVPELSIYLPEAVLTTPHDGKFSVKGKDRSGHFSSKLAGTSELNFKAHSPAEAQKWFDVIRKVTGAAGAVETAAPASEPASPVAAVPATEEKPKPVEEKPAAAAAAEPQPQETGVTPAPAEKKAETAAETAPAPAPAAVDQKVHVDAPAAAATTEKAAEAKA
ncbi:hypothetical protein VTJ49DRAFT_6767 [Mycothermus thermophilus]|uniref:PH domain-containing protein n=1 Tax=Humicola insolens TaxID=85995 RepID=A0ABR3VJI0_HUMIN